MKYFGRQEGKIPGMRTELEINTKRNLTCDSDGVAICDCKY
jgi:hypothetical protein